MWWVWVHQALAGIPDDVRPVIVRDGAAERYRVWQERLGLPASRILCDQGGPPGILVCYQTRDESGLRWVHDGDLATWNSSHDELRNEMIRRAPAHLGTLEWVSVRGTPDRYARIVAGDGWPAALLLAPQAMVPRLGAPPLRVAVPARGVALAFRPAGPDLDRIMAVGVREMFDTLARGVSPMVFEWDGRAWTPWGQAVAR